ncbi:MAG: hypothetical protein PIR02_04390 [Microbacterium enclense]
MLLLSLGVVVTSLAAMVVIIGASFTQRRAFDARIGFLRVVAASAAMSSGAGVMYVICSSYDGGQGVGVAPATALVLAAGLMCVAVSMVRERRAHCAAAATATAGVIVALGCALLSAPVALIVLLWTLALLCGACAVLTVHNGALPALPAGLLVVAMGFYAVYCAARALTLTVWGPDTALSQALFSFAPSLLAAVATQLLASVAIVLVIVPAARASRRRSRSLTTLTVADLDLVSAAYGPGRARELVDELRTAARDRDPTSVDVRYGVATSLPAGLAALTTPLAYEFGWRPEEIALVVSDADGVSRLATTHRSPAQDAAPTNGVMPAPSPDSATAP